ncbi:MlaD family protein [Patulibacter minatonensis]|uniref:MlaD family protein n=1 Tax=Patulibacter minatonensis TaxID=298163 RepID=UPI00047DC37C|nr:MlaD family protein [Patulibacter minatonensis]
MKTPNLAAKSFVLLLILVGGLAILGYFYKTAGGKLPLEEKPYKVTAILTDSQQVLKHADVRAAGVQIGEVGDIENTPDNRVKMVLEIKKKYAPIYRDAKILVRQKTLVGENYIDLTPGTAKSSQIADGGTLTVAAQKESVPIDKVLNTLNPKTRRNVSKNFQALGDSTKGRGQDINELFDRVAPLSEDGSALLDVLNKQRGQIARLVGNTGVVMGAIANRTGDLRTLASSLRTTVNAVAARDQAAYEAFSAIPPTLRQARSTVSNLQTFANKSTPTVTDLKVALQDLKPVLTKLRPTAARARRLTDSLPALFKNVNPALTTLPTFADTGTATVPKAEGFLRELGPMTGFAKPYDREVISFVENWSSAYTFDKLGKTARCNCVFDLQTALTALPTGASDILRPLLNGENSPLAKITKETQNIYRKPGGLVDPSNTASGYKEVKRDDSPNEVVK